MPGRASKIAACAAIAGIGGAAFGFSIHHLIQLSDQMQRPAALTQAYGTYRQELCFFHAIRSDVPEGAAVYVNSSNLSHSQRLAEWSTLWAVPKKHEAAAQWVLSISYLGKSHPPRRHPGIRFTRCAGGLLVVRRI